MRFALSDRLAVRTKKLPAGSFRIMPYPALISGTRNGLALERATPLSQISARRV